MAACLYTLKIARAVLVELALVGIAAAVIMAALVFTFGSIYPFYVVISDSMNSALHVDDLLVVSSRVDFADINVGDIILFNQPSEYAIIHDEDNDIDGQDIIMLDDPSIHGSVIAHRVVAVLEDSPRTLMTQGDANAKPIPGVDFPITQDEYLGKAVYIVPEVGVLANIIHPPVSYILIVVIFGLTTAYELHTHPKWRWRLLLLAFHSRDKLFVYLRVIKYDPKSPKAHSIYIRQTLKNHFAVILMSVGLMNRALKNAKTYQDVPPKTFYMYKDMLLDVARAGKTLDESGNILDTTLIRKISSLLLKIESTDLESGVGSGYPNYDEIKKLTAHCTEHLSAMDEGVVLS